MFSSDLMRQSANVNKFLHDYCKKSTEESIRKLQEKYNLERNKPKINNPFQNNTHYIFFSFFSFFLNLSNLYLLYCVNKRLC